MSTGSKQQQQNGRYGGEAWAKIVSASVGSTITALTVTPLEVVKVRQQAVGFTPVGSQILQITANANLPPNVSASPCPRGCGTFVLNTGLGEYLTSRCKAGYFDPETGSLKQQKAVAEVSRTGSPLRIIRSIFMNEGFAGIYAGLAPTLVMGIPNTVLYFYTYEELAPRLKRTFPVEHPLSGAIPAVAGASARFVASLSTAPLELLRTRQAARSGLGTVGHVPSSDGRGMISEFRTIIRNEGPLSLFRGVWPTIMRDVPFSAIYWLSIERMRDYWKSRHHSISSSSTVSTSEQTFEALINGSVSGVIAAAFTTPLDVLKTRSQISTPTISVTEATREGIAVTSAAICDHGGALAVQHKYNSMTPSAASSNGPGMKNDSSTIQLAKGIVEQEGISGLWRGNTARCMKVCDQRIQNLTCAASFMNVPTSPRRMTYSGALCFHLTIFLSLSPGCARMWNYDRNVRSWKAAACN
jgi:solute carrier family 25 protein 39/40